MNDKPEDPSDMQRQGAGGCGPGCACGTTGSSGRGRMIVGVVILFIAGVLVVRAVMKDNGAKALNTASPGFAALPVPEQTSEPVVAGKPSVTNTMKEITSLSELNTVATDTVGVFVFVPGKGGTPAKDPMIQILGAARMIEPQLPDGGKIGAFTLKTDSLDYEQIASQMAVPGVVAMVKGGGMSAASGDITETKLVQAFVAASSPAGCGPSGCGPAGCK